MKGSKIGSIAIQNAAATVNVMGITTMTGMESKAKDDICFSPLPTSVNIAIKP